MAADIATTYYDHSTYKQHAKSYTPTYHKEMSQGQKRKSTRKAPATTSAQASPKLATLPKAKAAKKESTSRDIEYIVDGYGHVHTIEHSL